ncbi:MAG: 3-isopropylmalate dehydrogenase [Alphaproteobacteria bacterium]|uniref:3-isopropylmalate dehydrogenase n=1 Tax=Maricaulis alexandrii TaxID=2570354 RepID=UPI001108CBAE|nr:3-isopropylmalate dehydrogenase [Maricaulis alexandrii]MCR9266231.1 3-isopropylmalate dehydrogenase [Alphaproteobacteria bacterium]
MTYKITLLPGDGIGPEITQVARAVLEHTASLSGFSVKFTECAFGGASIDQYGEPLTDKTLKACQSADAVFLGAVGGPKWDHAPERPEMGLLALRKALGVYANLRPAAVHPALADKSPLRPDLVAGTDVLIVRELTGGIYFGERERSEDKASDKCTYSRAEIERVARVAFEQARLRRGKLTSVDKANVLETSKLWRAVVTEMGQRDFPDIELDHMYVDAAAMHMLRHPASFDVLVTENMFGDILSDEASMLPGSIGLLGSASLGDQRPGLFEPIHGSAPDIAGQDKANPFGAIEAAAQLLESLDEIDAAKRVRAAVNAMHEAGEWTGDLGGSLTCSEAGVKLVERLERQAVAA